MIDPRDPTLDTCMLHIHLLFATYVNIIFKYISFVPHSCAWFLFRFIRLFFQNFILWSEWNKRSQKRNLFFCHFLPFSYPIFHINNSNITTESEFIIIIIRLWTMFMFHISLDFGSSSSPSLFIRYSYFSSSFLYFFVILFWWIFALLFPHFFNKISAHFGNWSIHCFFSFKRRLLFIFALFSRSSSFKTWRKSKFTTRKKQCRFLYVSSYCVHVLCNNVNVSY